MLWQCVIENWKVVFLCRACLFDSARGVRGRFECVNADCFVLVANLLSFGALKTSFSTVDECLTKAVWRGILSRLSYLGDESVALSGR